LLISALIILCHVKLIQIFKILFLFDSAVIRLRQWVARLWYSRLCIMIRRKLSNLVS